MLARRPLIWFAVMFAAGILVAKYTPYGERFEIAFLGLGIASLLDAFLRAWRRKCPQRKKPLAEFPAATLPDAPANETVTNESAPLLPRASWITWLGAERLLLAIGLLFVGLGCARQISWQEQLTAARATVPRVFTGRVEIIEPPEQAILNDAPGYWRCAARIVLIEPKKGTRNVARTVSIPVRLQGWGRRNFQRGDYLRGRLVRRKIPVRAFPGAYSGQQYLSSRGLTLELRFVRPRSSYSRRKKSPALATQKSPDSSYLLTPATTVQPRRWLDWIRRTAIRHILTRLPDERGAFLAAVMFGYRGELESRTREEFRNAGIGHVLAISGLHVGLIVALAWWGCSFLISDKRWLGGVCVLICLGYLTLSGGRVAALRASVLAVIYLSGYMLVRRGDFTNSLGAAALLLAAKNPTVLTDLGFQLSFAAVLFISRLSIELGMAHDNENPNGEGSTKSLSPAPTSLARKKWARRWLHRGGRNIFGMVTLSLSAWLGIWPLTAYAFQQINPLGILLNIVVIPLLSLVLAGGILSQAAYFLPAAISGWGEWLVAMPADLVLQIAHATEGLPWISLKVPSPPVPLLLAYYLLFALFFLRRALPLGKQRSWCGRGLAGLLVGVTAGMVLTLQAGAPPAQTRLTLLPGWHGDTLIIERASGEVAVIGAVPRSGSDVARYLHYRHRDRVDVVLQFTPDGSKAPLNALVGHLLPKKIFTLAMDREASLRLPAEQKSTLANLSSEFKSPSWVPLREIPNTQVSFSWASTTKKARTKHAPLVWWAVWCDGISVGLSEPSWASQLAYRFKHKAPGTEAEAVILQVKNRSKAKKVYAPLTNRWRVLRQGLTIEERAAGLRDRRDWGAIVFSQDASGKLTAQAYNGEQWVAW